MPEFAQINGRLHHFRFWAGGSAKAIVFANSLGTDLRIWDDVIDRLPPDLPILAYDKSGHGLSEGGADGIADFALDLAALMDRLDLRGALVCGVSFGGMIAQYLAAIRPELVDGLVLCNTSHRIGSSESWGERLAALDSTGLDAMADGILDRWFAKSFRHERPDVVAGYRLMLSRTPRSGYRAVCAAIRDADLTAIASRLTCPTLCIAGAEDAATPPAVVKAMADLIPGSKSTCLDRVGHLPCIEAPGPLAALILGQLEALP